MSVALARWPDNSRLVGQDSVDTERCRIPETSRHEALELLPVLVVVEEVYFWSNHQVGCVMVVETNHRRMDFVNPAIVVDPLSTHSDFHAVVELVEHIVAERGDGTVVGVLVGKNVIADVILVAGVPIIDCGVQRPIGTGNQGVVEYRVDPTRQLGPQDDRVRVAEPL